MSSTLRTLFAARVTNSRQVPTRLDGWAFTELMRVAAVERLGGFLKECLDHDVLILDRAQAALLEAALRFQTYEDLKRSHALHDLIGHLGRAGIDYRLMKGVAAAHTVYCQPDYRHTGDIDLLVPAKSLMEAARALCDAGYVPAHPLRGPIHQQTTRSLTLRSPHGVEIDLHRRYGDGTFWVFADAMGPFALDPLIVEVDGHDLQMLPLEHQMLSSLAHLTRPHWLVTIVDICKINSLLETNGAPGSQAGLPAGVLACVQPTIAEWVGVPGLDAFAPPDESMRRSFVARATFGRPGIETLEQVRATASMRDALRFMQEVLRPSPEWRRFRNTVLGSNTRRTYWRLKAAGRPLSAEAPKSPIAASAHGAAEITGQAVVNP